MAGIDDMGKDNRLPPCRNCDQPAAFVLTTHDGEKIAVCEDHLGSFDFKVGTDSARLTARWSEKPTPYPPFREDPSMPQDNKSQDKTPGASGGATWTNNEVITLKQLASENAPVSAMSTKLHKSEDVIRAKAKELNLAVTSW